MKMMEKADGAAAQYRYLFLFIILLGELLLLPYAGDNGLRYHWFRAFGLARPPQCLRGELSPLDADRRDVFGGSRGVESRHFVETGRQRAQPRHHHAHVRF